MRIFLSVLGVLLLFPWLAVAQEQPGQVSGTGTAEIKRTPEKLRLQVEVLARGKDLKEALSKLKERRQSVEKQLATLGATKESVEFSDPRLGGEKSSYQQQMERMVAMRMRAQGGGGKAKSKEPPAVGVSMTLKADWPLKAANPEELLLAAHQLQEKIKAADLSGAKELEKLSAKDEEAAEEAQSAEMMGMGDDGRPKPGEPAFTFICKIGEEERMKALKEAYQKAEKDAQRLAAAAGASIGPLGTLHQTAQSGNADPYVPDEYFGSRYPGYRQPGGRSSEEDPNEAVGAQAGKVAWRVSVTASYVLKRN